jgi:hypothetical protein
MKSTTPGSLDRVDVGPRTIENIAHRPRHYQGHGVAEERRFLFFQRVVDHEQRENQHRNNQKERLVSLQNPEQASAVVEQRELNEAPEDVYAFVEADVSDREHLGDDVKRERKAENACCDGVFFHQISSFQFTRYCRVSG